MEIPALELTLIEVGLAARPHLFACQSSVVVCEKLDVVGNVLSFSCKLAEWEAVCGFLNLHFFFEAAIVRLIILLGSSGHIHFHHDILLIIPPLDIYFNCFVVGPRKHEFS